MVWRQKSAEIRGPLPLVAPPGRSSTSSLVLMRLDRMMPATKRLEVTPVEPQGIIHTIKRNNMIDLIHWHS